MTHNPSVSIIVNNYNYGRFLPQAIDSALYQSYPATDVIVVDDGSTDHSAAIMRQYGTKIVPVFKENGGQASAFNVGVAQSRGDMLCFLDSDDIFHADKLMLVVAKCRTLAYRTSPILIHHWLDCIDQGGAALSLRRRGHPHHSPLNLYEHAKKYRNMYFAASPTSGLAITRTLADKIFPIPQEHARLSADEYIVRTASLIGELYFLDVVLGSYRLHGKNNWYYSRARTHADFSEALDRYLNEKLIENNREPVICSADSMYLWPELAIRGEWRALAHHLPKILLRQRDLYTAHFIYRTFRYAAGHSWRTFNFRQGRTSRSRPCNSNTVQPGHWK
jgi:glycosyltransferase involved in cell wall biosynthesis